MNERTKLNFIAWAWTTELHSTQSTHTATSTKKGTHPHIHTTTIHKCTLTHSTKAPRRTPHMSHGHMHTRTSRSSSILYISFPFVSFRISYEKHSEHSKSQKFKIWQFAKFGNIASKSHRLLFEPKVWTVHFHPLENHGTWSHVIFSCKSVNPILMCVSILLEE